MPSFTEKFLQTPHHKDLKSIIRNDGHFTKPVESVLSGSLHLARTAITTVLARAADIGREWARQFLPGKEKTAQVRVKLDLSKPVETAIRTIGDRATKLMLGPAGDKIKKSTIVENGRQILRVQVLGTYVKAALAEWQSHGIKHCKRIELDDVKTCPICIHLNSKEYAIDPLLLLDDPLTHDTHQNCRGAFVPIVNDISKVVASYNKEPVTFDLDTKNVTMRNAPIEYRPWLEQFFKRITAPFEIWFKPDIDHDYSISGGKLLINPQALHDEDPREIITAAMADKVPASVIKKTIKDYKALMELGVVTPPVKTPDEFELFRELYQQYLLNQLDDTMEVLYFKTYFDGMAYGKKRV